MILLDSRYKIPKADYDEEVLSDIKWALSYKNLHHGKYSKEDSSPYHRSYEETDTHLIVPRNFELENFIETYDLDIKLNDPKDPISVKFCGELHDYQSSAINQLMDKILLDFDSKYFSDNLFIAPCGSGKTVLSCSAISRFKMTTGILVPTKKLMFQWVARIKKFLNYDAGVYWGDEKILKAITVFSVPSLLNLDEGELDKLSDIRFSLLIGDEVHRLGSDKWSKAIRHFNSVIRVGFTATLEKDDGSTSVITDNFGSIAVQIPYEPLRKAGHIKVPDIIEISIDTDDYIRYTVSRKMFGKQDKTVDFVKSMRAVGSSKKRNDQIAGEIYNCFLVGRKVLCLSKTNKQIEYMKKKLLEMGVPSVGVINGKVKTDDQYDEQFDNPVVIAISRQVQEGFDDDTFNTIVFLVPMSSPAAIEQMLGRISRPGSVNPLVVDPQDYGVIGMIKMAEKRRKVYKKLECRTRK